MTDAARPDGGEAAVPQDAVPPGAGSGDPWAPPQDARTADLWAAPGAPGGFAGPTWLPPGPGPYLHPADGRRPVAGSNGLAITSLVTGITCCLWPAALGFGIAALIQLRRRRQRGLGLAVAGVTLGTLGLVAATLGVLAGSLHIDMNGATASASSGPALPLPGDTPGDSDGPSGLSQVQQDFVTDIAEVEFQDRVLRMPETDPGMATQESVSTAQVLADTAVMLNRTQWPSGVEDQIATLVSAFRADQAVWNAAAANTTDPVGAYQAALRTNAPSIAEGAARRAFGLTDDDRPADPGNGSPADPGGSPSAAGAAPAAV